MSSINDKLSYYNIVLQLITVPLKNDGWKLCYSRGRKECISTWYSVNTLLVPNSEGDN